MERKIIFDVLLHAQKLLGITDPVYLGLGSIWFADFRLAYRALGLRKMISIEKDEYAARADFNKPYESISVRPGDCLAVMRDFGASDWSSPQFAWLDYDGCLNADVAAAINLFINECALNSVLVVTVNGLRKRYGRQNRLVEQRDDTSVAYIEEVLGAGTIAPNFQPKRKKGGKYEDIEDSAFQEALADAILAFMVHRTNDLSREIAGKRLKFVPIFNLCHQDGASMVTVGGAIANDESAAAWRTCLTEHPVLIQKEIGGFPKFERLDLVPITLKEKLMLDACLPKGESEFLSQATRIGIKLSKEQIEKYRLFNRHFPVFVESPI